MCDGEMPSKCSSLPRQPSADLTNPLPPAPADSSSPPCAARSRPSAGARKGAGKKFTWEELAQHNSRSDALISVRGKVCWQLCAHDVGPHLLCRDIIDLRTLQNDLQQIGRRPVWSVAVVYYCPRNLSVAVCTWVRVRGGLAVCCKSGL